MRREWPPQMSEIGVIFDMDGVLVDSAEDHFTSWQAVARELGRDLTREQFAHSFGRRSSEIIHHHFAVADSAEIARIDARKEHIYRDLIRGRVPAMPGAIELVRGLHCAGLRLAVGSSGPPENIRLVCEEMNLTGWMSAIITGMDVERGKPDPQVFLVAASRMGLPANRCVVIEDAPAGVEAARRAGMKCIALTGSHEAAALSVADRIVNSLLKLSPDGIRELIG